MMSSTIPQYDLAVIGGGPAGLTAAIYAARAELKTVVLEKQSPGGQIQNTMAIENYPGFPEISGFELAERFHEHAKKYGAEIRLTSVSSVAQDGLVRISTDSGEVVSHTALITTGAHWKKMGVPGETDYIGRGVSSCAVCDGFFYKDKDVVVVGGGDSAIDEGIYLTKFARTVTIIHRRDALRAQRILQQRANTNPKIRFQLNCIVTEVLGNGERVTGVRINNQIDDTASVISTDGIFIYIGMMPNTGFLRGTLALDEQGFIIADERYRTSMPGVFTAGDVRSGAWRQIIAVAAEGALAVRQIENYISENTSSSWL
jgi:thioredoxin reductase (NADPH)